MKKIAIAAGSALLLASLAACGSSSTDNTATDTSGGTVAVDPTPTRYPVTPESSFLIDVHGMNNSYIEATTDSDLLTIGTTTCSALDDGNTIDDIITYLATSGTFDNADQAEAGGMIIAAAVADLCPEYLDQLTAYVS